jgi:hypothetical protein
MVIVNHSIPARAVPCCVLVFSKNSGSTCKAARVKSEHVL